MDLDPDVPGDMTMMFEKARARKMSGSAGGRGGGRVHIPRFEDAVQQQNQRPASPEMQPDCSKGHSDAEDRTKVELGRKESAKAESQPERPIPSRYYPPMALPANKSSSGESFYPPMALKANRPPPPMEKPATENRRQSYNGPDEKRVNGAKEEDACPEQRRQQAGWPSVQDNRSPPRMNPRIGVPQQRTAPTAAPVLHQRSSSLTNPEARTDSPPIKTIQPSSSPSPDVFGAEKFTEDLGRLNSRSSQGSFPDEDRPVSPPNPPPSARSPPARNSPPAPTAMPQARGASTGGTYLKPPPGSSRTPPAGWAPRPQVPPPDELNLPSATVDAQSEDGGMSARPRVVSRRTPSGSAFPAQWNNGVHRSSSSDVDVLKRVGSREGMMPYGYGGGADSGLRSPRAGEPDMEVGFLGSPGRHSLAREESIASTTSEVSAADWPEHRRYNKVSTHAQRAAAAILASAGVTPADEDDASDLASVRSEAVASTRPRVGPVRGRRHSMSDIKGYFGEDAVSSPRAGGGGGGAGGFEEDFQRGMRLAEREEKRRQRRQEQEKLLLQSLQPGAGGAGSPSPDTDSDPSVELPPVREEQAGRGGGSYDAAWDSVPQRRQSNDFEGAGRREGAVDQRPNGGGQQQRVGRAEGTVNGSARSSAQQSSGLSDDSAEDQPAASPARSPAPPSRPVPPPPTRQQPDLQELIASGASDITIVFETARAQRNKGGNRLHVPAFNDAVNQNIKAAPKWAGISEMAPITEAPAPPAAAPTPTPVNQYHGGVPAHVAAPPPCTTATKPKKKSWYQKFTK